MGYDFYMEGRFRFDKPLPQRVLDIFRGMRANFEPGRDWYREKLKVESICAEWCPWQYNEEENCLEPVEDIFQYSHNYWFIDWLCWIVEGLCIPNGLKLNGSGRWTDPGNERNETPEEAEGNGRLEIQDNTVIVNGTFFATDDWVFSVIDCNDLVMRMQGKSAKAKKKWEAAEKKRKLAANFRKTAVGKAKKRVGTKK